MKLAMKDALKETGMRFIMKMMIIPVFLVLKIIGSISRIIVEASTLVAGPFLIFVLGCSIYCIVKANWQSLLILALVGGGCILLYVLIGLLLGVIDIAGARMKRFLHS